MKNTKTLGLALVLANLFMATSVMGCMKYQLYSAMVYAIPSLYEVCQSPVAMSVVAILIIISVQVGLAYALRKHRAKAMIAMVLLVVVATTFALTDGFTSWNLGRNDSKEIAARFDYAFLDEDWEWIEKNKDVNKDCSELRVNYIYLAEAKLGVLCDRMFHKRHHLKASALLGTADSKRQNLLRAYVFSEIGAKAEADEILAEGSYPSDGRIRAAIGDVAEKPHKFDSFNTMLMYYVKKNPENKMACQYLLASDMLIRNFEYFFEDIEMTKTNPLPKHCQEAAIFIWLMNNKTVDGIPVKISKEVEDNYDKLLDDRRYHLFNKTHLSFKYGTTYWYYVLGK